MGSLFVVRTDQKSLKWLLQQKISTPFHQVWLSKLMGFDYEIQYKAGRQNNVADALSRVQGSELLFLAILVVDSNVAQAITNSYNLDINTQLLISKLEQGETIAGFSLQERLLKRQGKIVVGLDESLRKKLIKWQHASLEAGHSGRDQTIKRMQGIFY